MGGRGSKVVERTRFVADPAVTAEIANEKKLRQELEEKMRNMEASEKSRYDQLVRDSEERLNRLNERLTAQRREHERVVEQQRKLIDDLQDKLKQEILENPADYKSADKRMFDRYLQGVRSLTFAQVITREHPDERHIVFIGEISSGKSSLINYLFETCLPVSSGMETAETVMVAVDPGSRLVVWDAPGNEENFSYYDVDNLNFFRSVDLVVILWDASPRRIPQLLRAIHAARDGRGIVYCRSRCDLSSSADVRTPFEEANEDMKTLAEYEIETDGVFCTSRFGGYDTESVRQLIYNCPRMQF